MYDVLKIVNWLRVKNSADMNQNENVEELTQMKAMKLLYYIQAASLVINNKRLFNDDLIAWRFGPVVERVHKKYKGEKGIVGEISDSDINDYLELQNDPETSDILNSIYEQFHDKSALELMKQTHQEAPWKETAQSDVISDDKIKNYFSEVIKREQQ